MKRLVLFILTLLPIIPSLQVFAQWEQLSYAPNFPIRDMLLMEDKIYISTSNGGIYLSSDRGENWQPMNDGLSLLTSSIVNIGNTLFVGTLDSGIFKSEDLGAHWQVSNDSLLEKNIIDLKVDGNNVYALTESSGIWLMQGLGSSWIKIPLPEGEPMISAIEVKNGFIFAGTLIGNLFFSSNGGDNWVDLRNDQINGSVFYILFDNGELFVGTDFGMYYSSNMGIDWFNRSSGIKIPRVSFITKVGANLLLGTKGSGLFFSQNNGEFWFNFNDGLPDLNVNAIIADNFYVYAGTEFGSVSRRRLSDIAVPRVGSPKPLNPHNLQQGADTSIVFLWEEEKAAKGYHFLLSKSEEFSSSSIIFEQRNLTKNSISISGLEPLTYYWWKVAAIDLDGKEYWSEVFRFQTRKSFTIPTLIYPGDEDDIRDFPIVFVWTALDSVVSHTLQLSTSVSFETIEYEFTFPDTLYSLNSADLKENTKYFWRVISKIRNMGNETTSTSNPRSFYFRRFQSIESSILFEDNVRIYQIQNELIINFTAFDYGKLTFDIYNLFGLNLLGVWMEYLPINTQFILNIEAIPNGVYLASFNFDNIRFVKPIVILK
ncbi:MAG: hypothetical protein ACUVQ1_08815 [Candidatus Kapaibacteriales bacterium]